MKHLLIISYILMLSLLASDTLDTNNTVQDNDINITTELSNIIYEDTNETNNTLVLDPYALIQPVAIEYSPEIVILDHDGDGVLDVNDSCPKTPLGIVVDFEGCEIDTDNDGVVDSLDSCPNTRAGVIVNLQGCELDTDNDGILDSQDVCPQTLPGITVDYEGCELDTDADGVVDSKDNCPNTGRNFTVDYEGCPKVATLNLTFKTGKYDLSRDIMLQLEDFADFLNNNIGYELIIYGYTDNAGDQELNQILSQNRANAVENGLILYGIDSMRITSVGRGQEMPIADNTTKEGRAKNRRIEVELFY